MTNIILGWYDDIMMNAVHEINLTCKSNGLDVEISEDDLIPSPDDDKYDDSYCGMKYFRFETVSESSPDIIKERLRGTGVDVEIVDTDEAVGRKKKQAPSLTVAIQAPDTETAIAKTTAALIDAKTPLRPAKILVRNEIPRAIKTKPREFIYEIEVSGPKSYTPTEQFEKTLARYDIGVVSPKETGRILCVVDANETDKLARIIEKYGVKKIEAESMLYEILLAITPAGCILATGPVENLKNAKDS